MFKKLCIALLLIGTLSAENRYKAEGYYAFYDGDKRPFFISLFLPYNPTILLLSANPEISSICARQWHNHASLFSLEALNKKQDYDLIWLEGDSEWLPENIPILENARLIYTSTDLKEGAFDRMKSFLEVVGFSLLSHWYWEGGEGHALFLKKPFFDAYIRTLAYSPSFFQRPTPPVSQIEKFFKPAHGKGEDHGIEGIDFIYMINLDERPEKFELAARELKLYGINPYRFSAVNGWTLPTSTLSEVGAVFLPGTLREAYLGSFYKEVDGEEVLHTELIQENGTSYFTWGLARGPVGIILSHLSVLQDAYDSGYETIWVMEDDVEAIEDPRQIPSLLRRLDQLAPDWDIFFTDTDTKDSDGIHIPCRALAARPNVDVPPFTSFISRFYAIGEGFYRTGMRYGAYSMIFRRSGIKKILDYYKTYRIFLPYDMDLWLCPDLKMFHFERDLVSHRSQALSDNNTPRYKK